MSKQRCRDAKPLLGMSELGKVETWATVEQNRRYDDILPEIIVRKNKAEEWLNLSCTVASVEMLRLI